MSGGQLIWGKLNPDLKIQSGAEVDVPDILTLAEWRQLDSALLALRVFFEEFSLVRRRTTRSNIWPEPFHC